ncbi:MAG: FAD-dependent oxidoreductase [Oscillospiraceae bacterium]|nr:FAD-dependent oxidoreductase [Oscillospiraceae bacterium]
MQRDYHVKECCVMNQYYPHIFEPITISGVTFKNRIFTAPSMGHMLQNNAPTYPEPAMICNYMQKAIGGAAQVECGGQQVNDPGENPIHSKFDIENPTGWRNFIHFTNAIHFYDAKASYELIHFGSEGEYTAEARKSKIYGCSEFTRNDGLHFYQMPYEEMDKLADRYASLAECVKFCGFDTLLIHGGHGTLLQEFVSPRSNHRTDEFGGSMENRARFPLLVLDRIRQKVGRDLLIEYRISGSEFVPGGFEIEDCIEFFKLIQDRIDIAHISAGVVREPRLRAITHPTGFLPEACNAHLAKAVKACPDIKIPVLTLGAFQQPEAIERVLANGEADIVAMARGTIADPYTVNKIKEGRPQDIVPCIKCFHCLDDFKNTHCYSCSVNPAAGRESQLDMLVPKEYTKKNVAILGGGPGGMKAALLASERGHRVTLFEAKGTLGGQLNDADYMSFKYDLKKYKNYLIDHVNADENIAVKLNTKPTPQELTNMNFDSVICAVGADPLIPPIPGVDGENVIWAGDSFFAPEKVGQKLVVIGGGQVGCETAVHYGMNGKSVALLEMQDQLAPDAMRTYREELEGQVHDHATAYTGAKVTGITAAGVTYVDKDGGTHTIEADTVILAVGMKPRAAEAESYRDCAPAFRRIGDCVKVGNVKVVTRAAFDAAMSL